MKRRVVTVSDDHVLSALDGYLHALSILEDNEYITSVKRNKNNEFEVEVERD